MATNEQEPEAPPSQQERVLAAVGMVAGKVTDTGSTNPMGGISLRVWIIIVGIAAIVSVSAFPLNVLGVVLVTALALTLGTRSRRPQ